MKHQLRKASAISKKLKCGKCLHVQIKEIENSVQTALATFLFSNVPLKVGHSIK